MNQAVRMVLTVPLVLTDPSDLQYPLLPADLFVLSLQ